MLVIKLLLKLEISSLGKIILIPSKRLRACSYIMLTFTEEQNHFLSLQFRIDKDGCQFRRAHCLKTNIKLQNEGFQTG